MTQEHPITPSPSQLDHWEAEARATTDRSLLDEPAIRTGRFGVVHRKALCLAFTAGADMELEACCEWLVVDDWKNVSENLRAARRPKPPSLKEQALECLKNINDACESEGFSRSDDTDIIRRALEQLND